MADWDATQYAVQLSGPGDIRLVADKPVVAPTGHQILCRVESTGLCYSDLKLIKQFSQHARKTPVASGMDAETLEGIPSYAAGDAPTVPGHECVVRIVAVGDKVRNHKVGDRRLVQTDYRALRTGGGSNASFGYNFEGGLQEYVIIDERVSRDPQTGESYLVPVGEEIGSSAVSLVEPWACVEDSYASPERRSLKAGGALLIVADSDRRIEGIAESFAPEGPPARIAAVCADSAQRALVEAPGGRVEQFASLRETGDAAFDDIVYFGVDRETIEALGQRLAGGGIINIVTGGAVIQGPVRVDIGQVHYGLTRWVGTTSKRAVDGYRMAPATKEIRDGERCAIIGAGGPMGQMHVIRALCSGARGVQIEAVDVRDDRLRELERISATFAETTDAKLKTVNSQRDTLGEGFRCVVVLVPSPALVARAVETCADGCLVNIFAGIPAGTMQEIDLNALIGRRCYIFGTSGSELRDMKIVLAKLQNKTLDTNCSVAAVSGMAGAIEGLAAIESQRFAGKIVVYPSLRHVGLIALKDVEVRYPSVAERLSQGRWTREAEQEFLSVAEAEMRA